VTYTPTPETLLTYSLNRVYLKSNKENLSGNDYIQELKAAAAE